MLLGSTQVGGDTSLSSVTGDGSNDGRGRLITAALQIEGVSFNRIKPAQTKIFRIDVQCGCNLTYLP